MSIRQRFIRLSAVVLLLCLCGCGKSQPKEPPEPTAAPEAAGQEIAPEAEAASATVAEAPETAAGNGAYDPDVRFSTTDRNGVAYDESFFAGQTLTMINFWEPWCGPCVGEMPDLEKLYQTYKDQGFAILGVYATPDMEEDVDAVLEQTGATYPILHYTEAFDVFQSGFVPTTVFVDSEGHILRHAADPELSEVLSEYVAEGADEMAETLYIGGNDYAGWEAIVLEGLK